DHDDAREPEPHQRAEEVTERRDAPVARERRDLPGEHGDRDRRPAAEGDRTRVDRARQRRARSQPRASHSRKASTRAGCDVSRTSVIELSVGWTDRGVWKYSTSSHTSPTAMTTPQTGAPAGRGRSPALAALSRAA